MLKLSSGIRNPLQVAAEDAQGGPVQWNWCHPSAWSASLSLYQLNYINLYLRRPWDSLKINSFWSRLPRAHPEVWPSLCFLNALSIPVLPDFYWLKLFFRPFIPLLRPSQLSINLCFFFVSSASTQLFLFPFASSSLLFWVKFLLNSSRG